MSVISNSFKKNAALKLAKSIGITEEKEVNNFVEAWTKGFEVAESMFTEQ